MAMSRSFGGRSLTTRSPMTISPAVISSSPATIRSVVDLPQPDGPTSTMNSLSRMWRFTSLTAWTSSYFLFRFFSSTWAMVGVSPQIGSPESGAPGSVTTAGAIAPAAAWYITCESVLGKLRVDAPDLLLAPLHGGLEIQPIAAELCHRVDHHELLVDLVGGRCERAGIADGVVVLG